MATRGEVGSVVTLLCDSGERYRSTILNTDWLKQRCIDASAPEQEIESFLNGGNLHRAESVARN